MILNKRKCPLCRKEYYGTEETGQFTLHPYKEICNDCYLKEHIIDPSERNELRIKNAILNKNKSRSRLFRDLNIHYYKIEAVMDKLEEKNLVEIYKNKKGYKFYKLK